MADYYTHFCTALPKLSAKKLAFWRDYSGHKDDDGEDCSCFEVHIDDKTVVLNDGDGHVTMDHVAAVLRGYLGKFKIREPVIVPYANVCTKSRVDAFDGGVVVVWATKEAWLNSATAGYKIADGEVPTVDVIDYSTPLDELGDAVTRS
jgi:hypothetical protein